MTGSRAGPFRVRPPSAGTARPPSFLPAGSTWRPSARDADSGPRSDRQGPSYPEPPIALAFAAIGLYGVLAYTVASRTGEIGVRMALGARPVEVLRLVARESGSLVGAGIVLGAVGAAVGTRAIAGLLYGVAPADPLALVGAAVALGAVCLIATVVPARRATRIDPAIALRAE